MLTRRMRRSLGNSRAQHPLEAFLANGRAEKVPLQFVTAFRGEEVALLGGFDAFGDNVDAEIVAQVDDAFGQGAAAGAHPDVVDGRPGHPDVIKGQSVQVGQIGLAFTNVVDA